MLIWFKQSVHTDPTMKPATLLYLPILASKSSFSLYSSETSLDTLWTHFNKDLYFRNCQLISITLNECGFENVALHGMMPQKQRLSSLAMFKSSVIKILIATDVASRGLDIPEVKLVINHILPPVPKEYIHRVGRAARAGRSGMAISIIIPGDIEHLQTIEELIGTKLTEYKINGKFQI